MSAVQLALFESGGLVVSTGTPGSRRMPVPRWPLKDLLAADGIRVDGDRWAAEAAIRFGVHRRSVYRWRDDGLTTDAADRAAIAAGLHPAMVWAGWA